jgi:hypothetical protein
MDRVEEKTLSGVKDPRVLDKRGVVKGYGALWVCLLKSHGEGHVQVMQAVLCRVEWSGNFDGAEFPLESRATEMCHLHPSDIEYIIFTEILYEGLSKLRRGVYINVTVIIYTQIAPARNVLSALTSGGTASKISTSPV